MSDYGFVVCCRCKLRIEKSDPTSAFTAGYYTVRSWGQYMNADENILCDRCMWSEPRYIADYGINNAQ